MAVICENVTRPAMEHTFVAPALFMFSDVVVVTVTIFNLLGKGPASGPSTATIYGKCIGDVYCIIIYTYFTFNSCGIFMYINLMSVKTCIPCFTM